MKPVCEETFITTVFQWLNQMNSFTNIHDTYISSIWAPYSAQLVRCSTDRRFGFNPGSGNPLEREMANTPISWKIQAEECAVHGVSKSWAYWKWVTHDFQTLCLEPDSADRTMRFGSWSNLHSSNLGSLLKYFPYIVSSFLSIYVRIIIMCYPSLN